MTTFKNFRSSTSESAQLEENYEDEYEYDDDDYDEYEEHEDDIDNSHITYSDKKLYLRLNDRNEWRNRLEISRKVLMKSYLKLFEGNNFEDPLDYILNKVFSEGLSMKGYITNLSFTDNRDKDIRILALRPAKDGVYLNEALPEGVTLRFKGHVYRGVFIIDEIGTTSDSGYRDFEVEVEVTPFHTNIPEGWKDNFLNEIIDNAQSITVHTEERLEEWSEYLNWRKTIARRQIAGCKYYRVTCDYASKLLIFWLVCEGEEEFTKFKRYLRKDSLQAFSNSYSQEQWHFRLRDRDEDRYHRDKSIDLGRFKRIVEQYYLGENLEQANDENQDPSYYNSYDVYEDEENGEYENYEESRPKQENIHQILAEEFENPYIVKVAFELNKDDADKILEKDYDDKETENFIREEVLSNYFEDGFIALSAVGDFALINRFERAIEQLKRDENFSPNLALWLFDVQKAKLPTRFEEVDHWLNPGIEKNIEQRQAVLKMLSAPDLCLIQGPPGTGKTTVIAEAIYQFVRRGNRVLIASQSNDAVDNALERLADTSVIRAIRLGQKSRKKRNKEENLEQKFSEENALNYFYASVASQISSQWVGKWKSMEALKLQYETDLRDVKLLKQDIADVQKENKAINAALHTLFDQRNSLQLQLTEITEENQRIQSEKLQGEGFIRFLDSRASTHLALSSAQLEILFNSLNPVLNQFEKSGIRLNPIKLEVSQANSIQVLNEGLVETLYSFWRLLDLQQKLKQSLVGGSVENDEILLLERKKEQLTSLMDELDEAGADDEEYEKIHNERRKITRQINELKKTTKVFTLSGTEKLLFSQKLLERLGDSGNIQMDILNNVLADLEEPIEKFQSFIRDVKERLESYCQRRVSMSTEHILASVELNEVNTHNLQDELEGKRATLALKQKELALVAQKYKVLDSKFEAEELSEAIRSLYQQNNDKLSKNLKFRNEWEGLLQGFMDRLDNEGNMKYEKEYYQDIYVNACNVVGISCTDNMRALTDRGYNDFDVVIIDEVSKATPPELLIPLMKARKAILVGDHRQLPPIFNEHEKSYKEIITSLDETDEDIRDLMTVENFNRFKNMVTASLFKGYFEIADPSIKHSLLTQYRMHSDIMSVINRFYDNQLKPGFNSEEENKRKNHGLTLRGLDSLKFITPDKHAYWIDSSKLPDGTNFYESRPQYSTSTENLLECFIILELLKKMARAYAEQGYTKERPKTVGVISFYQIQVNRLRNLLKKERKTYDFSSLQIDVNTVDRFQGKEKEIILTSLVRNTKSYRRSEESHIAAFERINVAFSRAQEMLVIVGAKDMYSNQPVKLPNMSSVGESTVYVYKNIIEDLHRKACFYDSSKIVSKQMVDDINAVLKEY